MGFVMHSDKRARITPRHRGVRITTVAASLLLFGSLGFPVRVLAGAQTLAGRQRSTGLPLKAGSYRLTLASSHDHNDGATFSGNVGGIAFSGVSVQTHRDATDYVISGQLGREKFRLPAEMSVGVLHPGGLLLVVKVTGTLGGSAVHGTLDVGGKEFSFLGTAGRARVTMSAPLSAVGSTRETVLVKIG
jgi:hypothetical protein